MLGMNTIIVTAMDSMSGMVKDITTMIAGTLCVNTPPKEMMK